MYPFPTPDPHFATISSAREKASINAERVSGISLSTAADKKGDTSGSNLIDGFIPVNAT